MYSDPFQNRYGSDIMRQIWNDKNKYKLWRQLWLSLAQAQSFTKMVEIPTKTLERMEEVVECIDIDKINEYDKQNGHDVYAAILEYRDQCGPEHGKYIHLGATSQYVVDNADCVRIRHSLVYLINNGKKLMDAIVMRASCDKTTPCLGYTHGQKAQITTIGRRISMWGESVMMCLREIDRMESSMKWRGTKGAVGNQTGYCYINPKKVSLMEDCICSDFGFTPFDNCGQTYHRTQDIMIVSSLVALSSALAKMCNDIRLLCMVGEASEKKLEVGSSAMPYKSNPITSEKVCSLARTMTGYLNTFIDTASNQWLERSLDDSANRRVLLSKIFLTVDEIIMCCIKIMKETRFFMDPRKLEEHLPYAVMEWAVTKATTLGYDRTKMHEKMRRLSESSLNSSQLINRVLATPELKNVDTKIARTIGTHLGNSVAQTENFISLTKENSIP